ncbi:hypothetical protein RO3G_12708 [Rhizopus delemar RA 99-880]|uniref:SWIM-type domain-containing protein n=1 Tax=Rhizopus delemar (strain RA 99-880 / ATCC MYA-4621 / FGSC 9543 / NRRL 43880) TaxID=246409 RepID=I1CHR7_RHIO9|nr:hypothetical protein RO3G_12708 [Rhizopus delemar RA 99-880]|eukprot:EIE87997.1 hypothetical protein RO3G_12708 [Rhizopus delemar RA 99-880]
MYNVESFSQEDIMHTVQINEAGNIASCSCCYFKFNSRACKHMLLLKRHANILVENVSRMETLLSKLDASSIPKNELLAPTAENDSNINATSILKTDIKSISAISNYKFLTDISKRLKAIRDDIDSRDRSRRMEAQRSSNS